MGDVFNLTTGMPADDSVGLKAGYAAAIFACGVAAAAIAWIVHIKRCNGDTCDLLGFFTMFGAGVLLAAGFVHLFNDSIVSFGEIDEDAYENFPYMCFACSASVYAFIVLETALSLCCGSAFVRPQRRSEIIEVPERGSFHEHTHNPHTDAIKRALMIKGFLAALVLMLALCIHSFLAGIELGVSADDSTLIAILGHKTAAGLALGSYLVTLVAEQHMKVWQYWVAMSIFSLVTPIGVFVGIGIANDLDGKAKSAIVAVTAGMFIYVSLVEIVPHELEKNVHNIFKVLVLGVGWGFMSMLALWV